MKNKLSAKRLEELEKGALRPLIVKLAVPSILGVSASALSQIVNTYFIGKLGTEALAAVAIAFPFVMLLVSIGLCFGTGVASHIARQLGDKNIEDANSYASLAFYTGFVFTLTVVCLGAIFSKPLMEIFSTSAQALDGAIIYLRWMFFAYVILVLNMICGFIVRAEGNTKLSMKTQLVAFISNALLDALFIFGLGMGIHGAGLATVVAQIFGFSIYLHHFLIKRPDVNPLILNSMAASTKRILSIIKIGIAASLTNVMAVIALTVLNKLSSNYGDEFLAGIGIASRMIMIAALPINGLCVGSQAIIGYNVGAKNWSRVIEALKNIIFVALVFTLSYVVLVLIGSKTIASFFSTDPKVIAFASKALVFFHIALPFIALQPICVMYFQSRGDALPSLLVAIARQGFILLPFLILLHSMYGKYGLLYSLPAADLTAGLFMLALLVSQLSILKRKNLEKPAA